MTNAELITALRCCIVDFNSTQSRLCNECPYRIYADGKKACENKVKHDAADALEAADKRIAELEDELRFQLDTRRKETAEIERLKAENLKLQKQNRDCGWNCKQCEAVLMPKEGEWIVTTEVSDDGTVTSYINCSRCGFYWREPKHGKVFKRCPNCGAKMDGERKEKDE